MRPPVLCLTLTVLCPRLRGLEFSRVSVRSRLILCLWTATVAEAGMEMSCLTTHLGRPLILQEQMFLHSRYLVATTSTFSPFRPCGAALALFFGSTPAFRFYYYHPSFTSVSLLVGDSSSFSDWLPSPRKEGRFVCITVSFQLLPGSFCHRGKSKLGIGLFIHELLREPLINWPLCLAYIRQYNSSLLRYDIMGILSLTSSDLKSAVHSSRRSLVVHLK